MINLTIRNIPDEVIKKIKALSLVERRSLNCEILVLLEKGLVHEYNTREKKPLGKEAQLKLWADLSGSWKDNRSTKKIINDIYSDRTFGRDVSL
jgi:plasmid stability protein